MDPVTRNGDRLTVIEAALEVALQDPASPTRDRLLCAIGRATAVVRASQNEAEEALRRRSQFRVVPAPTRSVTGVLSPPEPPESGAPDGRWTARTRGLAR
jgi:hypothetical protein